MLVDAETLLILEILEIDADTVQSGSGTVVPNTPFHGDRVRT
jgi:hypothetical protein